LDFCGDETMTRRRWIADEVSGNTAALVGPHAAHLVRVLRARLGQEFDIAAEGLVRRGRICTIAPDDSRVEFELGEEVNAEAVPLVTLLLAVFKFDRMEWAIEKCTELGVSHIIPVIARRTDAHLAKAAQTRVDRWRRIAVQASEQSRRATVPEIEMPAKLSQILTQSGHGIGVVLAESGQQTDLKRALQQAGSNSVMLAVGPEGGWTDDELKLFVQHGWTTATLGPTILRAETAAIAALAVTMSELQDR
jgi:16S rRNA (uracil1498-N3)-methyltransferase